jgi:hypothetical protein
MMMFSEPPAKGKPVRCWSAWACGILVLILLSLPYYAALRAALAGRGEAIPILVFWGAAALGLVTAFHREKWGGGAAVIASLLAGVVLFAGYRSAEPMLDLIVTLLLLMCGILFLQCRQRKILAGRK